MEDYLVRYETIMKALKESFGPGYESMLQEINACAVGTRGA